jgi:DNA-binding transcriptional ArsR family regulator
MTDVPDVDSAEALLLAAEELDAQAAAFRERARGRAIEAQQYRRAAQTLTLRPPPLAAHPLDALNGRRKLGEAVLAYLRNVDEAPISTIAEHVDDDAPYQRTRGVLDKLMEMGLVVRTGLKRGTRYHVAGEDEDVDATPTRSRYEELVRDVARELGTFTVQDVLDAADISHATAARWLRAWVDAGALEVERVGQANVYAYVRPLPPLNAPTMRPRSEPKPWAPRVGGPVAGAGASARLSRREVRDLVRAAEAQGATMRETKHGYLLTRDGDVVGHVPKTASDHRSLDNSRAELRRNGVTV